MQRHLKEFLLLIVISLLSIYAYSQAAIDNEYIQSKINSARKQLKVSQYKYDCSLPDAILEINKRNISGKIDKDTLRKIARRYLNYDYNIEFIETELAENEDLNIETIKSKHADLYDVLKNPQFNKIGYNIVKDGNKNKIQFIVSENYIVFDLEETRLNIEKRKYFDPEKTITSKIFVKGESKKGDVSFIKIYNYSEIESVTANFPGTKLTLNDVKQFQFETEFDYRYLVFYDSAGNILSVFNCFLNE